MSLVKYAGISLIAMSASMGHAGGMEDSALSAGFMFEDGKYGSVSLKSQAPSIKAKVGGVSAMSKSVVGSVTSTNIKAKMDVLDNISVGITYYRQAGIKLDYQGSWSLAGLAGAVPAATVAAGLPKVDLDVTALAGLVKYDFNDNISALVGVKNGTASDATVLIPSSSVNAAATGKSSLSYVVGAAYEIPEIALRAELVYETSADYVLATTFTGIGAGTVNASTPNYTNLYVQSGIAEDTLAYATIRKGEWKKSQVSITHAFTQTTPSSAAGTPANISEFDDSTDYSIGLGRKFGDTWSSSISYNWTGGSSATTTSPFTLSNGNQGLSVGAKYAWNENTAISFGGNYTEFKDVAGQWLQAVTTGAPSNTKLFGTNNADFKGNSVTTLGVTISHSF